MDLQSPLVALIRERNPQLDDKQALLEAIEVRRGLDSSFRKLRKLSQQALAALDGDRSPKAVATELAMLFMEDGKTEYANPLNSTVTDLMLVFPVLLRRIMLVLGTDPTNVDDLRSLLNDLIALARPTHD